MKMKVRIMLKTTFKLFILALLFSQTLYAGNLLADIEKFNQLLERSRNGDDKAQHFLGIAYIKGTGTQSDDKKGIYWLYKSAKQGNLDSINVLGNLLIKQGKNDEIKKKGKDILEKLEQKKALLKKQENNKYKKSISDLGWAIIEKDTNKAIELINTGANLRVYENEESIKKIVTPNLKTTYIRRMDTEVYPLAILAASAGQDEVIKAMIDKDKEAIFLKDSYENDALMWASREGHVSTVKLLLEYGFDPLYVSPLSKLSAYELSMRKDKDKVLELFIAHLLKQNRIEKFEETIWRLAGNDELGIVKKLLELGVKDKYKGIAPRTSLIRAIEWGNLDNFKLLVKYGSDPYESNIGSRRYGYDPLTVAVNGSDESTRYLLENYDYDLSKKFDGDNYLHIAYQRYNKLNKETFLLLLKKSKLDINSPNNYGRSLLQKAVENADVKYVKFFMGLGLSNEIIKEGKESAKWFIDVYEKQYKKVENPHNLKNMENAKKIYELIDNSFDKY
jgi:ankyrin repeat protein